MANTNEVWMGIEGYPKYEVSNLGNVRSWATRNKYDVEALADKPKALVQWLREGNTDYYTVSLYGDGKRKVHLVHQLVIETFKGPRPQGMVTRHINGDSLDNRAENLTWGTYAENTADRYLHGTANFTGARLAPVLTEEEAFEVWDRAAQGETVRSIAKDFPRASYECVRRVARGQARVKAVRSIAGQAA